MDNVLIIIGFLYGSAFGIRVEAIMTVKEIRFKTEAACKIAEARALKTVEKVGRGDAFCVKDE